MKKKQAIICGTTGKMGNFLLRQFLNKDYCVIGLNKSKNNLKDNNYFEYLCDFENNKKLELVLKKIKNKFKHISLLINTIAIEGQTSYAYKGKVSSWKQVLSVNLISNITLIKNLIYVLKKNTASVIFFSGGGANIYPDGIIQRLSQYTCSKIALIKYTEILGAEVSLKNKVNFNIIAPGLLPGNIIKRIARKNNNYLSLKEKKLFNKINNTDEFLFDDKYKKLINMIFFIIKNKKISGKILFSNDNLDKNNINKFIKKDSYKLRRIIN
jgi:short-subunit dehydrogenase